jgi:hypothetical protein
MRFPSAYPPGGPRIGRMGLGENQVGQKPDVW